MRANVRVVCECVKSRDCVYVRIGEEQVLQLGIFEKLAPITLCLQAHRMQRGGFELSKKEEEINKPPLREGVMRVDSFS